MLIAGSVATRLSHATPPNPAIDLLQTAVLYLRIHASLCPGVCVLHTSLVCIYVPRTRVSHTSHRTHACVCAQVDCTCASPWKKPGRPPCAALFSVRRCPSAPPSSPGNRDLSIPAVTLERLGPVRERALWLLGFILPVSECALEFRVLLGRWTCGLSWLLLLPSRA